MTTDHARLFSNERRYGLAVKWLLLAAGALSLLFQPAPALSSVVVGYAALTALATALFSRRWDGVHPPLRGVWPYWLTQGLDALYVSALIAWGGGLSSPFYLLYPLLALKALLYAGPGSSGLVWLSFCFGPLYVAALFIAQGDLAFLADPIFLGRYLLLLALILGAASAAWVLASTMRRTEQLRLALDARTRDLATQTHTLQQTATDLGDRVLELRSLQEIAKALSATLYLDDTLHTIADRLSRLTGSPDCAVALLDGDRRAFLGIVAADRAPAPVKPPLALDDQLLATLVVGRSQTLASGHAHAQDGTLARLALAWEATAIDVIPMIARGQPIGALFVGWRPGWEPDQSPNGRNSPASQGERQRQRSLLESFAYFAATAVENAHLYSDAAEKRRELEAVLAGIGDGVLVASTEGALMLMNPVAERLFALSAPPSGAALHACLPSAELVDLLQETARSGQVTIHELPLPSAGLSSDGQPRTFQALAAPITRSTEAGEQVSGVVTVLRDITAQKELERMKSNFLSVVSHELKTPLHSIKGFVDIILMGKTGPVTELQRDFLGTVQEQTGHLQRLIQDLLEYSRLESGQIKLRPVEVSPAELAAGVLDKLSPLAANKPLHMAMELPPDFPSIEADAMRLEQVLTNLIENAIKFTPAGGGVRVLGWDRGDTVELAVADTGIGIPPEERERVFERFYQVDSSVRRRYKGTGLGLTICKHIVTQHGGRIWVADIPGPGSEFHLTLPKQFSVGEPEAPGAWFW